MATVFSNAAPSAPAATRWSSSRWAYALALGVIALYVGNVVMGHFVVDDTYIAFRYVHNFVAGNGLVFNPGERVEGYTQFLWVFMIGVIALMAPGVDLLRVAQTLGVAFGIGTILLVLRFSARLQHGLRPSGVVAAAFLAVSPSFAGWSSGGLETTMFTFLVLAGAYLYLRSLERERLSLAPPLLLALATMTRPDGALFFGLTLLHFAFMEWRAGRSVFGRRVLSWLLVFGAIYAPYFAWRYWYYGHLLPNTFYAKVGSGLDQYRRGVRYLGRFARESGILVVVALPLALLSRSRRRAPWVGLFALYVAAYTAYIIYVGGDGLQFSRFVVFIMPMLYLLIQEGGVTAYGWVRARLRPPLAPRHLAAATAAAVLVLLAYAGRITPTAALAPERMRWQEPHSGLWFPGNGQDHDYLWFDNYFIDRLAVAARWLQQNAPPGSLVATTPAGSISANMSLPVLDMLGLNDEHIAHMEETVGGAAGRGRAGHEKGDGRYVLSRNPGYILLGNVAVLPFPITDDEQMSRKLALKSEHELWRLPEFHQRYQRICVVLSDQQPLFRYFTFYQRRGLPRPAGPCPEADAGD